MAREWDAVVVGGGPAGAATAAHLSGRGFGVLVLDRETFPRAKPCGEYINPAAVQALARWGVLGALQAHPMPQIRRWTLDVPDQPSIHAVLPDGTPGFGMRRMVLDSVLLDQAARSGAEVRTGVQVLDLVRTGSGQVGGVRVREPDGGERDIRACLVVGADGLRSVVVRRLGLLRRPPRLRKVALTAHVRRDDGPDGSGRFFLRGTRYIGAAPVGSRVLNVAVVVSGEEIHRVAGSREEYFDQALAEESFFAGTKRFDEVIATGPFDWPTRGAVTDGALLVGDAAGYYDPFTGQGIYRALRGAELAVEVIDHALRTGDVSAAALMPYERAQRRAFAPGVWLQHLIEAFISRPRTFSVAARLLAARPALAHALVAAAGDIAPVRSLLDPRLLRKAVPGALDDRWPSPPRP
ncbi:MAG: NAD(P)/FAD-dependent oxidoreductase [Chloroflexota bacterium]|nr:NAD(P)/FAD-dependent oxidoreductase [Chloroflexota bacterium]